MTYVYMIQNSYDDLYVGISNNPNERLKNHNGSGGAKYTKRESKFEIVFLKKHNSIAEARKREIQIKKWRRSKKNMLIDRYKKELPTNS